MTCFISAVGMRIAGFAALMAMTYNLIPHCFSEPSVKNKIFTMKFIGEIMFFYLVGILNNSAFQVKYIFKSIMQHPCACFFATNAAGAIHNNVFIFLVFKHVNCHGQLLAKSIRR